MASLVSMRLGFVRKRALDRLGGKGGRCAAHRDTRPLPQESRNGGGPLWERPCVAKGLRSSPRIYQAQTEPAVGTARNSTTRGCNNPYKSFGSSSTGTSPMSVPISSACAVSST